jgi:hypothetical protein
LSRPDSRSIRDEEYSMTQTTQVPPTMAHRSPARWLALPLVMVVVALGVWVTGGLLTDNESIAMGLTGLWLLLAGAVSLAIAWRRRDLAGPVLIGYVLAAGGLGGFLAYTSTVDQVVDEQVVVATAPEPETSGSESTGSESTGSESTGDGGDAGAANRLVVAGDFLAEAHPTEGRAAVIETGDGTFLTLTDFVTDPGPDLKVYLVPKGTDIEDGVDLGALKGNKGDQQYEVPASFDDADLEGASAVIWCRAFSVAFGSAVLAS